MITPAQLEWIEGTPHSKAFADCYFQKQGLDESKYVYIHNSGLQGKIARANGVIRITELGFGTGLNFLLAWQELLASIIQMQA